MRRFQRAEVGWVAMDVHEAAVEVHEGTVPFRLNGETATTWYRSTGELRPDEAKVPLIVLHGGPGAAHDYLLSLADLARDGRAVVHYDQLGNGRSTHFSGQGNRFLDG